MVTHWIVDIMSVLFLVPTQEFGDTVLMTISLKLMIYRKGFILERGTKNISVSIDVLFVFFISEQAI